MCNEYLWGVHKLISSVTHPSNQWCTEHQHVTAEAQTACPQWLCKYIMYTVGEEATFNSNNDYALISLKLESRKSIDAKLAHWLMAPLYKVYNVHKRTQCAILQVNTYFNSFLIAWLISHTELQLQCNNKNNRKNDSNNVNIYMAGCWHIAEFDSIKALT